eukprot:gene13928-15380_t
MKKSHIIIAVVVALVVVAAIVIGVVLGTRKKNDDKARVKHPENEAYMYKEAAVATDAPVCSTIGSDILKMGGSAVDAAVASSFCTGVVNLHSTGIGGGGFMVIYSRSNKKSEIYNYRETAPANASERMYLQNGTSSTLGGLSVAVPGEVKGLYKVWKKYGKLSWGKLIDPSIKLVTDGFPLPPPVAGAMGRTSTQNKIRNSPALKKLLMVNGEFKKEGDLLKMPDMAKTLKIIKDNPHDFYNGTLAQQIVNDIRNDGGIITLEDMKNYRVNVTDPIKLNFKDLDLHTMPPPGSGAVLAMIINIIQGYDNKASDLSTTQKSIEVYQRLVESFKWGYARRALLGDPGFVPQENITRALNQMLNSTVADLIRKNKIKMDKTFNASYYGGYYGTDDFGTSHVSVLAKNGDAVSVTGTINFIFGSGLMSSTSGIIFNNEMDDFSTPGRRNIYGYAPTEANYIRPGKRPLSSMTPAIITDKNGDVKMIAGASGGSRIITGTAQAIINKLFFDLKLGPSVANPRLHHQLLPNKVQYYSTYPMAQSILDGLAKIGHIVEKTGWFSVVQAIYREGVSEIYAMSDPRKKGKPAGY